MKFETSRQQARLPREWHAFWQCLMPSDSFDSTIFVEPLKEEQQQEQEQDPSSGGSVRRVRFSSNVSWIPVPPPTKDDDHETTTTRQQQEEDAQWYSRRDIAYFRAEARVVARALLAAAAANHHHHDDDDDDDDAQENSWVHGLQRAYDSFCQQQDEDKDDAFLIKDMPNVALIPQPLEIAVGLERRVLQQQYAAATHGPRRGRSIKLKQQQQQQRRQLLRHLELIATTVSDVSQREWLVAHAAETASRPARQYAAFVAQWWWTTSTTTTTTSPRPNGDTSCSGSSSSTATTTKHYPNKE